MDPQEERIAEEVNDVDVTTEEVNAVGGTAANSEQQTSSRKVGLSMSCLGLASGLYDSGAFDFHRFVEIHVIGYLYL